MLIHGDRHGGVGRCRCASEALESVFTVRIGRQRHHFVQMVGLLVGNDRYRSAGARVQIQAVSVEVECRGDIQMIRHQNLDHHVGGGHAAAEALERVVRGGHRHQHDHVAVMVGFLFGAHVDAAFPYRRYRAAVFLLDELGPQGRGVHRHGPAYLIRRKELAVRHADQLVSRVGRRRHRQHVAVRVGAAYRRYAKRAAFRAAGFYDDVRVDDFALKVVQEHVLAAPNEEPKSGEGPVRSAGGREIQAAYDVFAHLYRGDLVIAGRRVDGIADPDPLTDVIIVVVREVVVGPVGMETQAAVIVRQRPFSASFVVGTEVSHRDRRFR